MAKFRVQIKAYTADLEVKANVCAETANEAIESLKRDFKLSSLDLKEIWVIRLDPV